METRAINVFTTAEFHPSITGLAQESVAAVRDAIPFLVITVVWLVISLVLYGLFLVTKPNVDYAGWVHASVFLPAMIGFLGHVLRQALSVLSE